LDPETITDPSGSKTADEWYILATVLSVRPSDDHLEPAAALGSYMTGFKTGRSPYEWPIAQVVFP
jgi:hypothetical protein